MDMAGFNVDSSNRDHGSSVVASSVHKYDFLNAEFLGGLDNRRFVQKGVGNLSSFSFNLDRYRTVLDNR